MNCLHPWFLSMVADQLAPVFTDLFQTSIDTGEVPSQWKEATVTALHKNGSKTDPGNYRPVSLTVIESFNILTDQQHGFRAKRSTETQLVLTNHDIGMLNNKKEVDVAILDFSKAFDKVPH